MAEKRRFEELTIDILPPRIKRLKEDKKEEDEPISPTTPILPEEEETIEYKTSEEDKRFYDLLDYQRVLSKLNNDELIDDCTTDSSSSTSSSSSSSNSYLWNSRTGCRQFQSLPSSTSSSSSSSSIRRFITPNGIRCCIDSNHYPFPPQGILIPIVKLVELYSNFIEELSFYQNVFPSIERVQYLSSKIYKLLQKIPQRDFQQVKKAKKEQPLVAKYIATVLRDIIDTIYLFYNKKIYKINYKVSKIFQPHIKFIYFLADLFSI